MNNNEVAASKTNAYIITWVRSNWPQKGEQFDYKGGVVGEFLCLQLEPFI